jgi:hypothetical protein
VNCERVQALVSARMDGVYLTSSQAEATDVHVGGCARCRAFEERSARVRTAVRIRPAEQVPDLTAAIMDRVVRERSRAGRGRHADRPGSWPLRRRRSRGRGTLLAAALVGALIGSFLVGGPWQGPASRSVAVAAVARSIRDAAPSIDAFQGSYRIDERGLSPDVPERHLEMDVAFLAPQRFRLDVHDLTSYPTTAWTPTDLTYIEDMPSTYQSGPTGCPGDLPPDVCPPTRTTVSRASDLSAAAPLPADLILPIATFGSPHGVQVVGEEELDGHQALQVEMSFARAAPLFPFLRLGGTWRPFFAGDRVHLWLDTTSWAPIRYDVTPSNDPARRAWEMRFGLPPEAPNEPILQVAAESVSETPPPASLFEIPGLGTPEQVPLADAAQRLGYVPSLPTEPGGLGLVTVAVSGTSASRVPGSVVVYAAGLDYLRLGEDPGWKGPGPFGPLDESSQRIVLPGGGVAFYEPAGEGLGRRLAIHGPGTDLYLETNVPLPELLSIASSIPVRGEDFPGRWRVHSTGGLTMVRISPNDALKIAGLSALPQLPAGYRAESAQRESLHGALTGVTIRFRERDTDAAGPPLIFHVEPRRSLPPPSSAAQSRVEMGTITGRWTPSRSLLEWADRGAYWSLQGDVDLRTLVSIGSSIAQEASG